jgi:hypothetical protein
MRRLLGFRPGGLNRGGKDVDTGETHRYRYSVALGRGPHRPNEEWERYRRDSRQGREGGKPTNYIQSFTDFLSSRSYRFNVRSGFQTVFHAEGRGEVEDAEKATLVLSPRPPRPPREAGSRTSSTQRTVRNGIRAEISRPAYLLHPDGAEARRISPPRLCARSPNAGGSMSFRGRRRDPPSPEKIASRGGRGGRGGKILLASSVPSVPSV